MSSGFDLAATLGGKEGEREAEASFVKHSTLDLNTIYFIQASLNA